jgi:pimeloyl-ACP methyl ester carboxylesterase
MHGKIVTTVALSALLVGGCATGTPAGAAPTPSAQSASPSPAPTAALEPARKVRLPSGRNMSVQCAGDGPVGVIFVGDNEIRNWNNVQPAVGAFSRACGYERLGTGNSDPPPPLQTFASIAADLDQLITALQLHRPVVVIAEKLGGPITMTWASTHPSDVKGILLLDPASSDEHAEAVREADAAPDTTISTMQRFFDNPTINAEHLDPSSWASLLALAKLHRVPLVVLDQDKPVVGLSMGLDPAKIEQAWKSGQSRWVAMSDTGTMMLVPSGNGTLDDHPETVIEQAKHLVG